MLELENNSSLPTKSSANHPLATQPLTPNTDLRKAATAVLAQSKDVSIDMEAVNRVAKDFADQELKWGKWGDPYPNCLAGDPVEEVLNFALLISALNFCFWSVDKGPRWKVNGKSGADALTASFSQARAAGIPVTNPQWLSNCTSSEVAAILQGDVDSPELPPLHTERVRLMNELGNWMVKQGKTEKLLRPHKDALELAIDIGNSIDGFKDVQTTSTGVQVPFLKRAQLAVYGLGDLLGPSAPDWLLNRSRLTAFADYRVPQILHHFGIIKYSPRLEKLIQNEELIVPNSDEEIELRAATVVGVEEICKAMGTFGKPGVTPAALDFLLWKSSRTMTDIEPHHRCLTTWY